MDDFYLRECPLDGLAAKGFSSSPRRSVEAVSQQKDTVIWARYFLLLRNAESHATRLPGAVPARPAEGSRVEVASVDCVHAFLLPAHSGGVAEEGEELSFLEASADLANNGEANAIVISTVPYKVLRAPEFSSLLAAYIEDVAAERRATECVLWVDVERVKAEEARARRPVAEDEAGGGRRFTGHVAGEALAQFGGDCSALNKEFGFLVKTDPPAAEAEEGRPHLLSPGPVECTAGPWFVEAEVTGVSEEHSSQGSPFYLVNLVYASPPLNGSSDALHSLPTQLPLAPSKRAEASAGFRPPAVGDTATLFCRGERTPLLFIRNTQEAPEPSSFEFLPGPWSVQVDVEMFADPLRPLGVGAQVRLVEQLTVTLPPTRVLPLQTEGLSDEQWLLLELADMHSQERQQREEQEEARQAMEWVARGEEATAWAEISHSVVTSLSQRLLPSSVPIGPCKLRRVKGAQAPVFLDCIPSVQPPNKHEVLLNGFDILRRGIWGVASALWAVASLNVPFHSLVKILNSEGPAAAAAVQRLSLFDMARRCERQLCLKPKGEEETTRVVLQVFEGWTEEQKKELDLLAAELLEAYARGGKDRRRHKKEGHLLFVETDSSLEIRVSPAYLSRSRRKLLKLTDSPDAELVFVFSDAGGAFHPFQKVTSVVRAAEAKEATTPPDVEGEEEASSPSTAVQQQEETNTTNKEKEEEEEERMTLLQLAWQNVVTPQHAELRRIAIGNVLWDVGVAAFVLLVSVLSARLMGAAMGRMRADALHNRRVERLTQFVAFDAAVIPGLRDEVQQLLPVDAHGFASSAFLLQTDEAPAAADKEEGSNAAAAVEVTEDAAAAEGR
ncbi:hypothetical protein Efla_005401 [Eimeria flavescens]